MPSLVEKIPWISESIKRGEWDLWKSTLIHSLDGETAGITGLGRMGRSVAFKLKYFELRVIAYGFQALNWEMTGIVVKKADLKDVLINLDTLFIHAPLTKETRYMVGVEEFKLMKKSVVIVNAARGAIINQKALYKALNERWVASSTLDVLGGSSSPETSLLKFKNVIITSLSSLKNLLERVRRLVVEEAFKVIKDERLRNVVNPEVWRNEFI